MLQPSRLLAVTSLLALCVCWTSESAADHDKVPVPPPSSTNQKLQAVPKVAANGITVSGISSGAFFAHQFHIAYSKLVMGAGLVAGGPYGCVENIPNPFYGFAAVPLDRLSAALVACTHYYGSRYFGLRPSGPKPEDSLNLIRAARSRQMIDDPANLGDDRVWLFHGKLDEIVPIGIAEALRRTYEALGIREPRLHADWNVSGRAANHGMPVARFTGQSKFEVRECAQHEPPYVIQCGFDAAGALLTHLNPENVQPASDDPHRDGSLLAFDQSEFFDQREGSISLHGVGYAYVPNSCAAGGCRLHVAFHGCKQHAEAVHDDFVRDAGYNRWAATNKLLVLYPQATVSTTNPNGCWDFWGYTGAEYYGQNGTQMRAVKAMVDRVLRR